MNAHYDFYESLGLDKNSSTSDLRASILETLEGLKRDEVPSHDARAQENSVALAVLGDDRVRAKYDARLADESAPRMGIPELRALATTGSFPDEQQAPAAAPAQGSPGQGSRGQGSHDDQATTVIPAAQPSSQDHSDEDAAGDAHAAEADSSAPHGQPSMPAQPYGRAAEGPAPAMAQAPAQPRQQGAPAPQASVAQLMDAVPGAAKALMFTLGGIAAFCLLMTLVEMLLNLLGGFQSLGMGTGHILSLVVAVLLIPKVLRGNDSTAVIPLAGASIGLAALYLSYIVLDITLEVGGVVSTSSQVILMLAWIAAAVLTFLTDTRAWLGGTYAAPAMPAAAQPQYGQYGAPQQDQPNQQPQFGAGAQQSPQFGQSPYGAQQSPQFDQSRYGAEQQAQQSQQPQFGQSPYGQSQFGQSQFGTGAQQQPPQFGQSQYGQPFGDRPSFPGSDGGNDSSDDSRA